MSHKFCKKIDLTFTYKIIFIFIFICFSCKKDDSSYSLNINTVNSGTVDIENGKYASGEIISLTATPSEGFAFIGWHGEGLENPTDENPLSIVMDSNKDITANFLNLNDPDYSGMGIWNDEIYSDIIHFLDLGEEPIESTSSEAWSKIVSAFVKDANRHGVDISYVLDNPIKYGIKDLGGPGAIAVRHCIDNNVEIIFIFIGLSRKRN